MKKMKGVIAWNIRGWGDGRSFYYVNFLSAERCYIFMYLYTFGNSIRGREGGGESYVRNS